MSSSRLNFIVFVADCVQGNCLFNALSDQLYGNQEMHAFLRDATIEHMRDNSEFYRQYMAVNNLRRNPKRTTTAAQPTRIDTTYYTEEQLQQQFEEHVEKMGQPGEWADNMEVSAFASALNVHVRLWQGDYTYVFSPRLYYSQNDDLSAEDDRRTLHIAYHVCLVKFFLESRVLIHLRPGSITLLCVTPQGHTQASQTSRSMQKDSRRSDQVQA